MHWGDLSVWKKSHALVLELYEVLAGFPRTERYGLIDQIKRASVSVPANIVEGQSRNTTREYLQFLYNARGSLEEVRYFLLLSKDLSFLSPVKFADLEDQCKAISKMLNSLIKSLKSKPNTPNP